MSTLFQWNFSVESEKSNKKKKLSLIAFLLYNV